MTAAQYYLEFPEILGYLNNLGPIWLVPQLDLEAPEQVQFRLPPGVVLAPEDPIEDAAQQEVNYLQLTSSGPINRFDLDHAQAHGFEFVRDDPGDNYNIVITFSLPQP